MMRAVVTLLGVITSVSADKRLDGLVDSMLAVASSKIQEDIAGESPLPDFTIIVKRNGLFNREFTARFHRGTLLSLASARRKDICTLDEDDCTLDGCGISCLIMIPAARLDYHADVWGDTVQNSLHKLQVLFDIRGFEAYINLYGSKINESDSSSVRFVSIETEDMSRIFRIMAGQLWLNKGRLDDFNDQMTTEIWDVMASTITEFYRRYLNDVVPSSAIF